MHFATGGPTLQKPVTVLDGEPMRIGEESQPMVIRICILIGALVLAVGRNAAAGEISGTISVSKPLTKERLAAGPYEARGPFVAGSPKGTEVDEFGRMVFYLEGEGLPAGQPIQVELRQQKRQFTDEVAVMPAGSTVAFPNGDPIFHNIFSLSKAKQFDLGYYPMNQSRSVKMDKPGVVQVYCHIHREMSAAVVVVPGRWYGRPGKDGHFALSGVPAGTYRLVVWHKSAGFFRRTVEIPAEGSVELTMNVPIVDGGSSR